MSSLLKVDSEIKTKVRFGLLWIPVEFILRVVVAMFFASMLATFSSMIWELG